MNTKNIFITGATDGIGKYIAIQLSKENYNVILHGRSLEKLNQTIKEIKQVTHKDCTGYVADLFDLEAVSTMCNQIQKDIRHIDVLVHNAGTYEKSYFLSKDNIEKTFIVNFVSNVLINETLFHYFNQNLNYRKENQYNLRIILVSSIAHQSGKYNLQQWIKPDNYNPYIAYANSKMAQIMYCYYISEYLNEYNIIINSLHPGVIDTKILRENFGIKGAPVSEGIKTIYYLITSPEVENTTGKYFNDKKIEKTHPETYNKKFQEELYLKTKEIIRNYI